MTIYELNQINYGKLPPLNEADLAAAKQSAETAAAAEQRTAQQETAALAEDIRKKAQQNSANVIRAIREAITG